MEIRDSFGKVIANRNVKEYMDKLVIKPHVFVGEWWRPCFMCTLPELHPVHCHDAQKES